MSLPQEDLALVARIVSGDQEVAEAFAHRYFHRFEYLARRAGIPHQDCEDVAQEIFVISLSQMQRGLFRGHSSLSTWLLRIVQGKIADYWRGCERNRQHITDSLSDESFHPLPELTKPSVDYSVVLSIRGALSDLPVLPRVILLLKHEEEYTLAEICKLLNLTRKQVYSRLCKAEDHIRQKLGAETDARNVTAIPTGLNKGRIDERRDIAGSPPRLLRAGNQQTPHGILLRSRQRTGTTTRRSASA
ncbi:MAG: RNA polymerase sigma factor [Blastocatellia bacterium]